MRTRILRSFRWPFSKWRLLAHALLLHTAVAILLRLVSYGRLCRWGNAWYPSRVARGAARVDEQLAVWAVRRAARLVRSGGTCLSEALATCWILRARGCDAVIRFGVGRTADTPFAHAWLEHRGTIIVGAEARFAYAPLDRPAAKLRA